MAKLGLLTSSCADLSGRAVQVPPANLTGKLLGNRAGGRVIDLTMHSCSKEGNEMRGSEAPRGGCQRGQGTPSSTPCSKGVTDMTEDLNKWGDRHD